MKTYLAVLAGLITGTALMMAAVPAMAAHVEVGRNIGIPAGYPTPVFESVAPVYVQPQPVYFERERAWREHVWRERERARYWEERRWQEHRY